jgi:bifunctional non-homologous end joining protein LigD
MGLEKYKQKRSFSGTPEPTGGTPEKNALRFVVQKHDASRLHYDFRLEIDGVLKSWAVPKGPSTDPDTKRLAMMVEDHPFDYRTFEGIISKGQYGGGTVMIWDEGTYEPAEDAGKDKKSNNKKLLHQLKAGKIKIVLKGKKLQGAFALVKAFGRGGNSWLLMKLEDKYATKEDILKKDKSVVSKKDLKQIAEESTDIYDSDDENPKKNTSSKKNTKPAPEQSVKKIVEKQVHPEKTAVPKPELNTAAILKKGKKKKFTTSIKPMLATLVDEPFDDPEWEFEIKWDGYRTLAFMNQSKVELKSRNNKSFNEKFYPVLEAIKNWGINAVVDGEIVVVNEKGISNFNSLQNWRSEADGELLFYVFDVLWLDGKNLMHLPLQERKAVLQILIPEEGIIRIGFSAEARGIEFFDVAHKMGLEGIIAKRSDSQYHPGKRSKDWLKIKVQKRHEVIVAGFTKNEGSPKLFSSLLLGVYEKGQLQYVGKVGTGFKNKQQKEMIELFKPITIIKSPFEKTPDHNKPSRFRPNPPNATVTWLKPQLVCEINFTEITEDGVFRHPSFIAMREDKNAKDIVKEKEISTEKIVEASSENDNNKIIKAPSKSGRETLLNPTDKTQVRKVNGHELKFTNLHKVFWPEENLTKRNLLNYYYQIGPYMLPYLKGRPQSLNRFPNGINGKNFYQKDVTGKVPDWVDTYLYHSEGDKKDKHFLVGSNEASLLYVANLGAIEMNPWSSTTEHPDHPSFCIIDLDPDKNSFDQVIEAAQVIRQVLDSLQVPCFCKTSGSTGLHIYIPLGNKYTYEQSKEFARVIVTLAHQQIPKFTSIERIVSRRKGKMYLDFLQNRPQATIAAPYSLRPKPGATVSMPLHWDEVKPGLKMKDFTIFNAVERVADIGDIFKPVLGTGIDLEKAISKFEENKEDE